jgi:hypothetical protein
VVSNFELGYDGKEEHSAWDCFEMESGFSSPIPVRVTALDRRKKRKRLGFLCLGLGLGKLGLGYPGSVSGSSVIFCPDLSPISSTIFVLGPISLTTSEDLLPVAKESSTVFDISDECSSISYNCLSISDKCSSISDECSSPGYAKNDLIGAATVAKPLAISARKDLQAWFFGWLRAGLQHDEKLLAKLDVIVERTSHAKLDALSPDCSTKMLRMQEKLASLDVESRQAVATSWLNLQAQSGKE